jgi:5'-deoxynucleotidase YfbR-like HD superfamily hydrolase
LNHIPGCQNSEQAISESFLNESGLNQQLQKIVRKGWLIRGIPKDRAETDLAHCQTLAKLISSYGTQAGITKKNHNRALAMARIHELPEIILGDQTPYDKSDTPDLLHWQDDAPVEKELRAKAEKAALGDISAALPLPIGIAVFNLGVEFIEQKSELAKMVRYFDILATIIQAVHYVQDGLMNPEYLQAFLEQAEIDLTGNPFILELALAEISKEWPSKK